MMTSLRTRLLALAVVGPVAQAAGPLYLNDSNPPRPLVWETGKGPIPVWTDGGGAFTYDFDGVTPFITIERANEITQFAFDQWGDVPTATFTAKIKGTIASRTGIADVTGANAAQFYEQQNGYGFWVLYDTDGSILGTTSASRSGPCSALPSRSGPMRTAASSRRPRCSMAGTSMPATPRWLIAPGLP